MSNRHITRKTGNNFSSRKLSTGKKFLRKIVSQWMNCFNKQQCKINHRFKVCAS